MSRGCLKLKSYISRLDPIGLLSDPSGLLANHGVNEERTPEQLKGEGG